MFGAGGTRIFTTTCNVITYLSGAFSVLDTFFPCKYRCNTKFIVCSCLRICSRETGSAVPSHVSLLISILRLNLMRFNDNIHQDLFQLSIVVCIAQDLMPSSAVHLLSIHYYSHCTAGGLESMHNVLFTTTLICTIICNLYRQHKEEELL